MRSPEDLENYFVELELPYERLDDSMWVIHNEGESHHNVVIYMAGTAVTLRVKLFDAPQSNELTIYRRLLELNATEMVHGAYGLEDNAVVITDALELENLDVNELQATIDAIGLACVQLPEDHGIVLDNREA